TMQKRFLILLFALFPMLIFAQRGSIVQSELKFDYSISQVQGEINNLIPLNLPSFLVNLLVYVDYPLKGYKVVYNTVDYDGNPTTASGLVVIPQNYGCGAAMATYCHGTVFNKNDVPSNLSGAGDGAEFIIGLALGGAGYVSVLPDYLGLGDSPDYHPYVDARTGASATIDMMRAARQLCNQLGVGLNGEVFLSGYSQGGHVGMATLREIAQNHANEFDVEFAGLGSGPYDLSDTQYRFIFDDPFYATRQYILYVASSCQETRGDVYNNPSDILVSPFDALYTTEILGQTGNVAWVPLPWTDLFVPGYLTSVENNSNHPLRACLKASDVYNWLNYTPTTMYFCPPDAQVDPENAKVAKDKQRKNIPWYLFWKRWQINTLNCGNFAHEDCVIPSLLFARTSFNSYRNGCGPFNRPAGQNPVMFAHEAQIEVPQITHFDTEVDLSAYAGTIATAEIYNLEGQVVHQWNDLSSGKLPLLHSQLQEGYYALKMTNTAGEDIWALTLSLHPELAVSDDYNPISPSVLATEAKLDLSLLEKEVSAVHIRQENGQIQDSYLAPQDQLTLQRRQLPEGKYLVEVVTVDQSFFLPLEVSNIVSIDMAAQTLGLYPNPMKTEVFLDLDKFIAPVQEVKLVDMQGRVVYAQSPAYTGHTLRIPRGQLAEGMYTMLIQTKTHTYQTKLAVE
ncbi:MAG: T9SS type A sorting domain-containing protein, partial [Bacteroidota bacterium]